MKKSKSNKEKKKKVKLLSSPAQIWRSKISWKIALAAFLTMLTVQAIVLNFMISQFQNERLRNITLMGREALVPVMDPSVGETLASPLSEGDVKKILNQTVIKGLAIYSNDFDLIQTYGEPLSFTLINRESVNTAFRSADGTSYDVVYTNNDLMQPYFIAAKLNSAHVQAQVFDYLVQNIVIMALLSGLVTTVLMIALGHWLLEPILFMRKNLVLAAQNPEAPEIEDSPFNPRDEIGGAIDLAEKLIKQNAANLKQIKSSAEDQIHKLAYYDTLTGLPNRTLFLETLNKNMRAAKDGQAQKLAVLTLDLDHFKDVNDSMGHSVGDAILRGVGKRLRSTLPESAMVSRSGEDEFAIMIAIEKNAKSGRAIAERVINVIRSMPFEVFSEQFQVRASVGVSVFPDDGLEPDQVLKNADIALNRAKEEGRDTIKEYSEDFDKAVQKRFQMLRDLRDALENEQIKLHYQPQFDLKTGKIIGAEALLRWWKPDNSKKGGAYIPPVEFIPVAEQSGLIVPIGEEVLRMACATAQHINKKFKTNMRMAVNVSAVQFSQSNLVEFVEKILKETGLSASRLELEVTESVFMDDINHTIHTLKQFHALGVELAIDDFGTGYSSLSYLRQFPIDRLKIDQSFIRNALNNPDDAAITRTIIALGHSLNLKIIAEGVETKEHEQFLVEHNCDEVQGFRYSKPVPADELEAFIEKYNGKLSSFG